MPIRKKTRRPIQTRGRTKFNRSDLPVVIRVSDESQALIPHVDVARAIGFIKAKARQLTHLIWRSNEREGSTLNSLPYRTYYYAMPGSTISIIELKTNPREQSWHARIVGGVRFGNFIMIPEDDPTGERTQILVKAAGRGGPYEVFIEPDLVAKNIDWKGPIATTEEGDEIPHSADVLSWFGPNNRVGPSILGPVLTSDDVFKGGAEYTKSLDGAHVSGIAIQGLDLTDRRDVLIVDDSTQTGGVQGQGAAEWRVYTRPEGVDLAPGVFNAETNPTGWRLIATLVGPDDFNGERWARMRTWFFNRSGTQASAIVPINIDEGGGPPDVKRDLGPGLEPILFPMDVRVMSIDIDVFADPPTAVLNDEGIEPSLIIEYVTTVTTCNASGGGDDPVVNSYATQRVTNPQGSRKVGVDYKGDTRVFATMQPRPGGGGTVTWAATSETGVGTSVSTSGFGDYGWSIKVGATEVDVIADSWTIEVTGFSGISNSGSVTEEHTLVNSFGVHDVDNSLSVLFGWVPNRATRILYCDLRNDLLIWTHASIRAPFKESSTLLGLTDFGGCGGLFFNWAAAPAGNKSFRRTLIEAHIAGDIVASYEVIVPAPTLDIGSTNQPRTTSQFIGSPPVLTPLCCFPPSTFTLEREMSFESFTSRDTAEPAAQANRPRAAAVDTAGNTALSVKTYVDFGGEFVGTPPWINFITGDDLIDVMNQVTYDDGGEPPVELPPIEAATGHAKPNSIKVI